MCIRDRARIDAITAEVEIGKIYEGTVLKVLDFGAIVSVLPVSYTHLRAHETVLDLVCRLLLEKKKQIITHQDAIQEHFYHTKYLPNKRVPTTPSRDHHVNN